jgi:hypothetical protein
MRRSIKITSGVQEPGLGQCLATVAGSPGDGQVRLVFQQHRQALADEVLVRAHLATRRLAHSAVGAPG